VSAPLPPGERPATPLRLLRVGVGTVMVALILVGVATITFMHAFGPRDGESIAHARVDEAAHALQQRLTAAGGSVDAATLAAEKFTDVTGATVEPYSWRGTTSDPDGARVDVRIRVSVQPQASRELFQPGVAAGSAQGCYRYHVHPARVFYRPIDCPSPFPTATPEPATPSATASTSPSPSPSPSTPTP